MTSNDVAVSTSNVAIVVPGSSPVSAVTVQQKQGSDPPSYDFNLFGPDGTTQILNPQTGVRWPRGSNATIFAPPGTLFQPGQTVGFIKITNVVGAPSATFTVFADPTLSVSLSASGPLISARFTLTTAQLLALQTTAILLLPAPGPGQVLVPVAVFAQYKKNTTAFTIGAADNAVQLEYAGKTAALASVTATGLLDQSADTVAEQEPEGTAVVVSRANSENLGIEAKLVGTTPALTLGDGSLVITLLYYQATLN